MSAKSRIYERLKAGTPWKIVIEDSGKSTLYSALAEYFSWAERTYNELQKKVLRLEEDENNLLGQKEKLVSDIQALVKQFNELENVFFKKKDEMKVLEAEVNSKQLILRSLEGEIVALRERGVCDETLAIINRIEFGDGDELVSRVRTQETHQQLLGEVDSLREERSTLHSSIEEEQKTQEERRRKASRVLAKIESLLRLKKKELATTQGEVDEVRGTLKALRENILSEIESSADGMRATMRGLSDDLKKELNIMRKDAAATISITGDAYKKQLDNLDNIVRHSLMNYNREIEKWGEMKSNLGAHSEMILYGYTLLGVLKTPDAIRELPLELIIQVIDRIISWVDFSFPDVYTTPSPNVDQKEYSLTMFTKCRLSSLLEWIRDDLVDKAKKRRI